MAWPGDLLLSRSVPELAANACAQETEPNKPGQAGHRVLGATSPGIGYTTAICFKILNEGTIPTE